MKRSNVKKGIIAAVVLCLVFLLGAVVVQNMPDRQTKRSTKQTGTGKENDSSESQHSFRGLSTYIMGEAYGSCGMYYSSDNGALYYLDAASGKESIVCTKTNCEHKMDSMKPSGCEADFNHVAAFVPSGERLYYIPADPLGENTPMEIWKQDLTGGNQKKILSLKGKENTGMIIQGMLCDGMHMVVGFIEYGRYTKKGKYVEYGSFDQKSGLYVINMNDWSYQCIYLKEGSSEDGMLGKNACPTISTMSMGTERVWAYYTYYDSGFDPKKYNKMTDKNRIKYMSKHSHLMRGDFSLSDVSLYTIIPQDGNHSNTFYGNWCYDQDYSGNLLATNLPTGDSYHIYSSPATEKHRECDSGYRGVVTTENSILYVVWNKKREKYDWYRYDRKTTRKTCIASPAVDCHPQGVAGDYIYGDLFWSDDHMERCAIPIKELEKGKYQFPEKSKEEAAADQNKENIDPDDTVTWGVNDNNLPSDEAVKEINSYLKKKGYDFKVAFTNVQDSDIDNIAKQHPEIDILQAPANHVTDNLAAATLKSGYFEPLTSFLSVDGKKLKAQFSKLDWKKVEVNREIYSVPNSNQTYEGIYIAYSNKLKNKASAGDADTLEKVGKILTNANVKSVKYPVILQSNLAGGNLSDFTDSDYCLGLALNRNSKKPSLWYEDKSVRAVYQTFNEWYKKGWLSEKNKLYDQENTNKNVKKIETALKKGDWLVTIGYGPCSEEIKKHSAYVVRPKHIVFSNCNMSTGVAAASNCKDQAETFLMLAYTDQTIADLMLYDIRKGNYQVKNNVVCDYSKDYALSVIWRRTDFGNQIAATQLDTDVESATHRKKYLQSYNAAASPLIGFQPDTDGYEGDLEVYIPALQKGEDIWQAKNFDDEYDGLMGRISMRKINKFCSEVAKQINAWK